MTLIRAQKLDEEAILPQRHHYDDAGMDIFSIEDVKIPAYWYEIVGTGFAIEIPRGYAGFIQPRSGLALKHGITVLNTPGLIDPGYRGEVKVLLYNISDRSYSVKKGDRIAQLVITSYLSAEFAESDSLVETKRGSEGFGSTGNSEVIHGG